MRTRLVLLWFLVAVLGSGWLQLTERTALAHGPSALVAGAAGEKKQSVSDEIELFQRTKAYQLLPGLVLFLISTIALSSLLWIKARDAEKLRVMGWFEDQSSNGSSGDIVAS